MQKTKIETWAILCYSPNTQRGRKQQQKNSVNKSIAVMIRQRNVWIELYTTNSQTRLRLRRRLNWYTFSHLPPPRVSLLEHVAPQDHDDGRYQRPHHLKKIPTYQHYRQGVSDVLLLNTPSGTGIAKGCLALLAECRHLEYACNVFVDRLSVHGLRSVTPRREQNQRQIPTLPGTSTPRA